MADTHLKLKLAQERLRECLKPGYTAKFKNHLIAEAHKLIDEYIRETRDAKT